MIQHSAEKKLRALAAVFKAVAITGARQSGKTTLVKAVFKDKTYVSLENTGHEVDLILEIPGQGLLPIEIKSGKTISKDFFKNLNYWSKLSGATRSLVLYGGLQTEQRTTSVEVLNWRNYFHQF